MSQVCRLCSGMCPKWEQKNLLVMGKNAARAAEKNAPNFNIKSHWGGGQNIQNLVNY